jgi:hypothetical protein
VAITIAKLNTVTNAEGAPDHNLAPGLKAVAVRITMDGSYAAPEPCDMSDVFPNHCYGMSPIGDADGWMLAYEPAATFGTASGSIVARNTLSTTHAIAFPTVSSTKNLTGIAGNFIAYGN